MEKSPFVYGGRQELLAGGGVVGEEGAMTGAR